MALSYLSSTLDVLDVCNCQTKIDEAEASRQGHEGRRDALKAEMHNLRSTELKVRDSTDSTQRTQLKGRNSTVSGVSKSMTLKVLGWNTIHPPDTIANPTS